MERQPEVEPEPGPGAESGSDSGSVSGSDSVSDSVSDSDSDSVPVSDSDSVSDPVPDPETARIVGTLVDTEVAGAPLRNTQVEAVCTCLSEPRVAFTDAEGRFAFEALPAGVYTIVATRGGRPSHQVVAVGEGDSSAIELRVGPPTSSSELDARAWERQRANTMIAAGGVAGVGALVMLLAAAIERSKPDCKFGLPDCADAPRPAVAIGLGVTGGLFALASAALIGTGVHRIRKLNARISVDDRAMALVVSGRF